MNYLKTKNLKLIIAEGANPVKHQRLKGCLVSQKKLDTKNHRIIHTNRRISTRHVWGRQPNRSKHIFCFQFDFTSDNERIENPTDGEKQFSYSLFTNPLKHPYSFIPLKV